MLCINQSTRAKRVVPNILPCEISHTGTVSADRRFWNPQTETITRKRDTADEDQSDEKTVNTVYFRGRKLLGRTSGLPDGYRGVVVSGEKKAVAKQEEDSGHASAFARIARRERDDGDDLDGDDADEDMDEDGVAGDQIVLESMDEVSSFQHITVWEHEADPSAEEPFSRGVEEWLAFAQAVHDTDEGKS